MRSGIGQEQLRLRPYRHGDIDCILAPREDFARELQTLRPRLPAQIAASQVVTLERGADLMPRDVLAVGGIRCRPTGDWSLWCVAEDLAPREWAMVARAARGLIQLAEQTFAAQQIEMFVEVGQRKAAAFAQALGFRASPELPFSRAGALYEAFVRERR